MNILIEMTLITFVAVGGFFVGVFFGWLGGFVHGNYWRHK
jgi:hypothetical protein